MDQYLSLIVGFSECCVLTCGICLYFHGTRRFNAETLSLTDFRFTVGLTEYASVLNARPWTIMIMTQCPSQMNGWKPRSEKQDVLKRIIQTC